MTRAEREALMDRLQCEIAAAHLRIAEREARMADPFDPIHGMREWKAPQQQRDDLVFKDYPVEKQLLHTPPEIFTRAQRAAMNKNIRHVVEIIGDETHKLVNELRVEIAALRAEVEVVRSIAAGKTVDLVRKDRNDAA